MRLKTLSVLILCLFTFGCNCSGPKVGYTVGQQDGNDKAGFNDIYYGVTLEWKF